VKSFFTAVVMQSESDMDTDRIKLGVAELMYDMAIETKNDKKQ
jgi:hypothetical protein